MGLSTATAEEAHGTESGCNGEKDPMQSSVYTYRSCQWENIPQEGAEHGVSLCLPHTAVATPVRDPAFDRVLVVVPVVGSVRENGEGDEASEPEQHGDGIEGKGSDGVVDALGYRVGGDEVEEDEDGPEGGEEHEVDATAVGVEVAGVLFAVVDEV